MIRTVWAGAALRAWVKRAMVLATLLATGCFAVVDVTELGRRISNSQESRERGRPVELAPFEPVPLVAPRGFRRKPPVVLTVRVYADEDFRAATPRWQAHARQLIASASEYTDAALGAQLQIESLRPWARRGSQFSTDELLEQLAAHDDAKEVDQVIGLVSPLSIASTSMHAIGMAFVPGRHFVMRGLDDRAEATALAMNFDNLDEEERNDFLARRRRHKELAVFLHEFLHNLGGVHDGSPFAIMHPTYAPTRAQIAPATARMAALVLDAHVTARLTGRPPDYSAARAFLESVQAGGGNPADREELERRLGQSAQVRPAGDDGVQELRRAVDERRWDDAIAGCAQAATDERGQGGVQAAYVAEVCARSGMPATAATALGRADAPEQVLGHVRRALDETRRLYGVPPGRTLPIVDEVARARAWFRVREALDKNAWSQAESQLRPALQRFGGDAGLLALGCELQVRRKPDPQRARKSCDEAVRAWDQMPAVYFWSGYAEANGGDPGRAAERLTRAIDLDPARSDAWHLLADVYRLNGRRHELATLRARYEQRFGRPLR